MYEDNSTATSKRGHAALALEEDYGALMCDFEGGGDDAKRKQQRVIANRHSARKSRAKKLAQISQLEEDNIQLAQRIETLLPKVTELRDSHAQLLRMNLTLQQQLDNVRGGHPIGSDASPQMAPGSQQPSSPTQISDDSLELMPHELNNVTAGDDALAGLGGEEWYKAFFQNAGTAGL